MKTKSISALHVFFTTAETTSTFSMPRNDKNNISNESFSKQTKMLNHSCFFFLFFCSISLQAQNFWREFLTSIRSYVIIRSSPVTFWKTFQNWWTNKAKERPTLSNSMILYGIFDKIEHRTVPLWTLCF